jgi:hypothetical protein
MYMCSRGIVSTLVVIGAYYTGTKHVFVIPTTIQPRPPLVGERVQDSSVLFN